MTILIMVCIMNVFIVIIISTTIAVVGLLQGSQFKFRVWGCTQRGAGSGLRAFANQGL